MATKNDPMPKKLSRIDDLTRPEHRYLTPQDECFYWGEYFSGMGYDHGRTNNLILNLKKSPTLRGTAQYQYKERAIQTIGVAMMGPIGASGNPFTLVPVPPSRIPGHPEFDDRMVQVAQLAVSGTQSVVRQLVRQTSGYQPSHAGGDGHRITPAELMAIYEIAPNEPAPLGTVLVVDDVLTEGAHFRAMKDTISARYPGTTVVGLMVARRKHAVATPDDFEVL